MTPRIYCCNGKVAIASDGFEVRMIEGFGEGVLHDITDQLLWLAERLRDTTREHVLSIPNPRTGQPLKVRGEGADIDGLLALLADLDAREVEAGQALGRAHDDIAAKAAHIDRLESEVAMLSRVAAAAAEHEALAREAELETFRKAWSQARASA